MCGKQRYKTLQLTLRQIATVIKQEEAGTAPSGG